MVALMTTVVARIGLYSVVLMTTLVTRIGLYRVAFDKLIDKCINDNSCYTYRVV